MSTYWIGVLVAFACIFFTLVAIHVTCFDFTLRGVPFLSLLLCFLSWIVPIAMIAGFVLFMLYFVVKLIVTFFFSW